MNSRTKVSILRLRRTMEKTGYTAEAIEALLGRVGRGGREVKPLRLTRKIIKRCLQTLDRDGQAGLFVTKRRKIYVISGTNIKISSFNFQKEAVRKKALSRQERYANQVNSRRGIKNLTSDQKKAIFDDFHNHNASYAELGKKYGISEFTARRYARKNWERHAEDVDTRGLPVPQVP